MLIDAHKSVTEIYYDYWDHKGHNYSECYYNEKIKNIYINIPKNASTNIKNAITNSDFSGINLLQHSFFPKYESAVVILRDPIDRWISGITTYLNHYHINEDSSDNFLNYAKFNHKWFFEILFERVSFDDHTEKQIYFLNPFDLSNAYFFYAQDYDLLEYQLTQFYMGEGVQIKFSTAARNCRKQDPIHQFFTGFLFDSSNRKYKEKLVNYFKEDYKLINSINFYGTR
jgi:hypothetical protein